MVDNMTMIMNTWHLALVFFNNIIFLHTENVNLSFEALEIHYAKSHTIYIQALCKVDFID